MCKTESQYISKCDLVIATTYCMKKALVEKYPEIRKIIRVRNVPLKNEVPYNQKNDCNVPLKIIWHGKSINIYSARGVYLIIQAVLQIEEKVDLFLQGSIKEDEVIKLNKLISQSSNNNNNIILLPPASADRIIESIEGYDIGFIGEISSERNQILTSSNKLFDYISAGLAILSPTIPGILETTENYKNSSTYAEGSLADLKSSLSMLITKKDHILQLKANSREASKSCVWENDFKVVLDLI